MRAPLFAIFALSLGACGGAKPSVAGAPSAPACASPDASGCPGTAPPATSIDLRTLPPVQPVPPDGVRGSDVAKVDEVIALYTCQAKVTGGTATGGPPNATGSAPKVSVLSSACEKTGAGWTRVLQRSVKQSDGDASQIVPFRAESGRCYRVYQSAEASVGAVHITLRDSAGKDATAGGTRAVPEDGRLCFSAAGDASLIVSVGSGGGTVDLELWSQPKN